MEPAELIGGFPAKNLDDMPFSDADYAKVVRETRVAATKIASEIDFSIYQATYDDENKRIRPPTFTSIKLTAPRCKPSETGSSSAVEDDSLFKRLSKIQWKAKDPPTLEGEEQDDPAGEEEEENVAA